MRSLWRLRVRRGEDYGRRQGGWLVLHFINTNSHSHKLTVFSRKKWLFLLLLKTAWLFFFFKDTVCFPPPPQKTIFLKNYFSLRKKIIIPAPKMWKKNSWKIISSPNSLYRFSINFFLKRLTFFLFCGVRGGDLFWPFLKNILHFFLENKTIIPPNQLKYFSWTTFFFPLKKFGEFPQKYFCCFLFFSLRFRLNFWHCFLKNVTF